MLTYQSLEPLPFPSGLRPGPVSPTRYRGTMHLLGVTEGDRTFIEWSVRLSPEPQDADSWLVLFQSWIPEWTNSLVRALARHSEDSAGKRDQR